MKPKTIEASLPREMLRASFEPATLDAESRTVDLLFYTGAYVRRYSFEHGPIELAFSMTPSAVRMDRMNSGAPLLNAHSSWDLSDVIGVVEKASVEGGKGYATVRFSDRDNVEPIFRDVQNRIIRNVSMGAVIHQMKEVTEKGDATKKFLAIDWEPMEISLVPIGADPGATALAEHGEQFPCTITLSAAAGANARMEGTMKVRLLNTNETIEIEDAAFDEKLHSKDLSPPDPVDDKSEDRKLADLKDSDSKRQSRIRELMVHFELDDVWAQRHIKLGSSVEIAVADGRRRVAAQAPQIDGRLTVGADYDSIGWKSSRIIEALAARAMRQPCPDPARQWERATIAECAYVILEQRGETRGRVLDPLRSPYDVVRLAMGTSDFPGILANVLNKTLLPAYETATPSYRRIAQQRNFRDYRPHRFVRPGDFPLTLQVGEGGEVTEGAMGESSETVTALKYGRILNILWEILANDDVGAFADFGGLVARRIVDRENALFYATCIAAGSGLGPALADGVAVHNSAHGNVNSAGALSNDRLNEAFGLMAAQVSIDGLKSNTSPRVVLTSATSHILARTLLTAITPAQASQVNPFAGMLEAVFDANLSGTRYYVIADPASVPCFIYGTVNGQGPRFEVRQGFEVEGVQVKAVHDFGCGAIDYRGTVSGAGA